MTQWKKESEQRFACPGPLLPFHWETQHCPKGCLHMKFFFTVSRSSLPLDHPLRRGIGVPSNMQDIVYNEHNNTECLISGYYSLVRETKLKPF